MYIAIFSDDQEHHVPVPTEYATIIGEQLNRIECERQKKAFTDALLRHFGRVLGQFLDCDLKPPTEKQVAFAFRLSKQRNVEIPREALIYRSVMFDFLEKYSSHKRK